MTLIVLVAARLCTHTPLRTVQHDHHLLSRLAKSPRTPGAHPQTCSPRLTPKSSLSLSLRLAPALCLRPAPLAVHALGSPSDGLLIGQLAAMYHFLDAAWPTIPFLATDTNPPYDILGHAHSHSQDHKTPTALRR